MMTQWYTKVLYSMLLGGGVGGWVGGVNWCYSWDHKMVKAYFKMALNHKGFPILRVFFTIGVFFFFIFHFWKLFQPFCC